MEEFKDVYKNITVDNSSEEIKKILQIAEGNYESILYLEGDIILNESLDFEFIEEFCVDKNLEFQIIIVNGNLTVNGRINLSEYHPGLIVTGHTKAHTLEGGDCEIHIQDGIIDYFVLGNFNSGILHTKKIKTQFIINNEHHLIVDCEDAIFINIGSSLVDNYKYHYSRSDLSSKFIPEVIFEKYLDNDEFYNFLKAGKEVFKSNH
ncbi:hypothetical protein [uncultured Maribacter sp.]|uniref:hypothetical protein n=1 Tax=uncultured Maribacter sp. TaxID=431308 RepID=UPI00262C3A44|nr:hypothetical protein [uncultured Maribacter sp.]